MRKANPIPTDDDNDLRLRKDQPARIHGHLLPDLVPSLPNRPALTPDLDFKSMDNVRHFDHTLVLPDSPSDPSRLVQSYQQQHPHEDRVRRSLQYVCASAEHYQ